jgi:hypothetical protein
VELLRGECDGAAAVGLVAQHRPRRPERGQGQPQHPLRLAGVDGHARGAQPAVEQELGEQAAERVPHDDRRADDAVVVVHDLGDAQPLQRRQVAADRLDVAALQPRQAGASTWWPAAV